VGSGSVPNAGVRALHRVVSALQAEGIEFRPNGVSINKRPAPTSTVIASEGAAA
jgi:hypothetical protein